MADSPADIVGDIPVLWVPDVCSSGTLGLGLALAGIVDGHPAILVTDPGMEPILFALLGVAETLPVLLGASVLTGFASALFNPAVRAYVAVEAGERRVEAITGR